MKPFFKAEIQIKNAERVTNATDEGIESSLLNEGKCRAVAVDKVQSSHRNIPPFYCLIVAQKTKRRSLSLLIILMEGALNYTRNVQGSS